ncbi:hypothetical protein Zmor_027311, partial [Zophobas morio]
NKEKRKEREFRPSPIVNEMSDEEDNLLKDYRKTGEFSRSRGAEIAPPPTYDYYGPSDSKRKKQDKRPNDVSESIEAGLKYLREQMEKKQSGKRYEDIFLS